MFVVDASVFNKLFLDEPDRPQAQALFRYAIRNDVQLMAPSLLLYEALSVALHYEVPFEVVHALLDAQRRAGFTLIEPHLALLKRAEEITKSGNPKAGHPALQDAIYHALALETDGTLVTADRKYAAKTGKFGGLVTLSDWQESIPV